MHKGIRELESESPDELRTRDGVRILARTVQAELAIEANPRHVGFTLVFIWHGHEAKGACYTA